MKTSKIVTHLATAFFLALSLSSVASATSYSFSSNDGNTANGSVRNDLNDLDHYKLYVWGIDPKSTLGTIAANNEKIVGASISFKNIYNWANETNDILKVYLVDNPKVVDKTNNGIDVWTAADNQNTTGVLKELTDPLFRAQTIQKTVKGKTTAVANPNYRFESITDLWTWTDAIDGQHAQTTGSKVISGHDLTYNFDAAELTTLMGYFASANSLATAASNYATFGLGFDPDCHYYNDGIVFTLETAPITTAVPEPGTMMLLGFGMFGLAIYGKRRMNKDA